MSLNGLDDPAVIEAYQAALVEAGGWLLLKYVARDVVALLARGTGGVAEIRITIDGYKEKSPLYGFLQYRRRKIVLRYVPEGISRLLQARITVQFQSILEKFSPHDTVFSLATSSELTESALSSACLLHTASRSLTSSTSSLRRCRLDEITEDAEENSGDRAEPTPQNHSWRDSIYSRASEVTAVPNQREVDVTFPGHGTQYSSDMPGKTSDKPLPSVPQNHGSPQANGVARKASIDQMSYAVTEPRNSTQSSRPSIRDFDQVSSQRPKVKLGPRPSLDSNGRPRTAGSLGGKSDSRPVASLPAGVRYTTRKTPVPRPKSQTDLQLSAFPQPPKVPPVPALLVPPPPINIGPISRNGPSSPRSVMSVPTSMGMSPEKQRLMRALQLRKQQMEKRAEEAEKKKREQATSGNQEKVGEGLPPEAGDLPSQTTSEGRKMVRSEVTASPQQPGEVSIGECVPVIPGPHENETKTMSTKPSKSDSAVDITECSSFSTPPDVEQGEASASQGSPVLETPAILDYTTSNEGESSEPDSPQKSRQPDQNTNLLPNPVANTTQPESQSVGEQSQLRTTEVEVNGDFLDSATPTPRAIPTRAMDAQDEAKMEAPTQPDTQDIGSVTVPTEGGQFRVERDPSTQESHVIGQDSSVSQQLSSDSKEVSVSASDAASKTTSMDKGTNTGLTHKASNTDRRKKAPETIHIPTNPEFSDEENLLSDDSLMEELKSASVQEAKPIALPKSGTSDTIGSPAGLWPGSRAVSNPTAADSDLQALPVGRSASGTYFENQRPVPVLVARKVNVSSGISKRIKALEMFSSRETSHSHQPVPPPSTSRASSPFEKFRKRASLSQSTLSPAASSNKSAPEPESVASKTSKRQESHKSNGENGAKPGSVSVTARIIRDPSTTSEPHNEPSDPSVLNLQRSEITVEQNGENEGLTTSTSSVPLEKPGLSMSSSAQSSRTSVAGHVPRSDSRASRLSISSFSRFETSLSHSSGEHTVEDGRDEKKESRKSRIIRRMSSITSNSRRGLMNALSSTVKEEESPKPVTAKEPKVEETAPIPQAIDIGEVNVQFPDTLLWKRRFMRIDDQGYLSFTPGNIDGTARNIVKRYHLSEFRTPCLPDQDRQELPNSIVLDFLDGSTLQCACESRQGQHAVLQALLNAHRTFRNSR
ncbi:hypothetical protein VTO42DRAFT_1876 [Malbranchea cinnamomea]